MDSSSLVNAGPWPWIALAMAVIAAAAIALLHRRRSPSKSDATPTTVVVSPPPPSSNKLTAPATNRVLPKIDYEEDTDVDPTLLGLDLTSTAPNKLPNAPVLPIVFDDEAAEDEPTHAHALIVTSGSAQTDKGLRRKRNEDSLLVAEQHALYVVADGMGGHAGGAVASSRAIEIIQHAYGSGRFDGTLHKNLPRQASDLARAIQMANLAILAETRKDESLEGMGTTIAAACFSPNKQRLYIGHVGDSRVYRLRQCELSQMTVDHTMQDFGVTGPEASNLSRAVGLWPVVPIDVVLVKPQPKDVYLLCTDGLTKMVTTERIRAIMLEEADLNVAAERLIAAANANGGRDNVTVILVRVESPRDSARGSSRRVSVNAA